MVTELYDATKVNSGNFKLEMTNFVFSDMVNEAVHTIEILQPAYSIRVIDSATGVSVRQIVIALSRLSRIFSAME